MSPLPPSDYTVRPACAPPAPGQASCLSLELRPATAAARAHTHPLGITRSTPIVAGKAAEGAFGLRPQDLHSAYQLPTGAPSAQTIAIVDAYNDPNAEADLNVYRKEFGLPECTRANGCFQQVNQHGESGNLPFPESQAALEAMEATCTNSALTEEEREAACTEVQEAKGWTGEISLDIEVAHATCQNCNIVLVEANSPSYSDLEAAENTAVAHGAKEVSNSWGGQEPGSDPAAFNHPGVVITASTGDNGYENWDAENPSFKTPEYPASSPHVVAVGGTRLKLGPPPLRTWQSETVWNGQGATGGGCSRELNAPPWQLNVSDWSSVGCGLKRATADVSAVADPYTGVAVFDSQPDEEGATWRDLGGTSLSSPLIASVFALAGGSSNVPYPARTLYENIRLPESLHDIASGSNGECTNPPIEQGASGCPSSDEAAACASALICRAAPGYDGPTGVGTPEGLGAFVPHPSAPSVASGNESSGQATAKATVPQSSTSPVSGASPIAVTPVLSALSLTHAAIVALNRTRPRVSKLTFLFTSNAPVRVRVTLAKRVRVRGHTRWQLLPDSMTVTAVRGRNSASLHGHNTLTTGRYELTLVPAHGAPRSLTFQIG